MKTVTSSDWLKVFNSCTRSGGSNNVSSGSEVALLFPGFSTGNFSTGGGGTSWLFQKSNCSCASPEVSHCCCQCTKSLYWIESGGKAGSRFCVKAS